MYRFISLVVVLILTRLAVYAVDELDVASAASVSLSPYALSIERVAPMDTTGMPSGLARVLKNYYRQTFTSPEKWAEVESFRFDGALHLAQGTLPFTAYKKKPDYCKVVLKAPSGARVVMSYNGQEAWQINAQQVDGLVEQMPEAAALNFIRDATTGGHLLYPLIPGKQMELLGIASFDGKRCYEIGITLPDGEHIRSFLDVTTYAEVRQITINHLTGDEEIVTHSDFREIDGVSIPFVSVLTIDGQEIHQSRIKRVRSGVGLAPWMFDPPVPAESDNFIDDQKHSAAGSSAPKQKPVDSSFQLEAAPSFFDSNLP